MRGVIESQILSIDLILGVQSLDALSRIESQNGQSQNSLMRVEAQSTQTKEALANLDAKNSSEGITLFKILTNGETSHTTLMSQIQGLQTGVKQIDGRLNNQNQILGSVQAFGDQLQAQNRMLVDDRNSRISMLKRIEGFKEDFLNIRYGISNQNLTLSKLAILPMGVNRLENQVSRFHVDQVHQILELQEQMKSMKNLLQNYCAPLKAVHITSSIEQTKCEKWDSSDLINNQVLLILLIRLKAGLMILFKRFVVQF